MKFHNRDPANRKCKGIRIASYFSNRQYSGHHLGKANDLVRIFHICKHPLFRHNVVHSIFHCSLRIWRSSNFFQWVRMFHHAYKYALHKDRSLLHILCLTGEEEKAQWLFENKLSCPLINLVT